MTLGCFATVAVSALAFVALANDMTAELIMAPAVSSETALQALQTNGLAAYFSQLVTADRFSIPYLPGYSTRSVCKVETKDGKQEKCCKDCRGCKESKTKCLNGEGNCKCEGVGCKKQHAAYLQIYPLNRTCYKTVKSCKDVQRPYDGQCQVCNDEDRVVEYPCGETCSKTPREVDLPNTVDCIIPGNCTTTVIQSQTCNSEDNDVDCKMVQMPKPPKSDTVTLKDCIATTETKKVCVDTKVPTKTCITVVTPGGQKCENPGGTQCKEVPDGTIKQCQVVSAPKTHCSTVDKQVPYNCRQESKQRDGKCTTTMTTKEVCERGGIEMTCRDVIKTEHKCKLVEAFKEDCPMENKKVCHTEQVRTKIEGSCKNTIVPCLGYEVRNDASRAIPIDANYSAYNECTTTAFICQYEYKPVPKCIEKSVPVPGKPCRKIATHDNKCEPIQTKTKVCFRAYGTPTIPPSAVAPTPAVDKIEIKNIPTEKCYPDGVRCAGAPGYPEVPYMSCCTTGYSCLAKNGDWGRFCLPEPAVSADPAGSANPVTLAPPAYGHETILTSPVRTYADGTTCKQVQVPETKCDKVDYQEQVCDQRMVQEQVCHDGQEPKLECKEVPKFRKECYGDGPSGCTQGAQTETKCSVDYENKEVCQEIAVYSAKCTPRTLTTCTAQGYYEQKVCTPRRAGAPKCTNTRKDDTKCDPPTTGKCRTAGKTTVIDTKCTPRTCTKAVKERKCQEQKCTKHQTEKECEDATEKCACDDPPFVCSDKPTHCHIKAVTCPTGKCGPETCTPLNK
jgi:hypothetical protein